MRASLLANATASLFGCNRSDAVLSHPPKLYRSQLCGRISRTFAAWINSVRRYLLPRLPGHDREQRASPRRCRTVGAAFTVVGALAHREASAMGVGAAGSTP